MMREQEVDYMQRMLQKAGLVGATVEGLVRADDHCGGLFPGIRVRRPDGAEYVLWIQCDPEGNGGGWIAPEKMQDCLAEKAPEPPKPPAKLTNRAASALRRYWTRGPGSSDFAIEAASLGGIPVGDSGGSYVIHPRNADHLESLGLIQRDAKDYAYLTQAGKDALDRLQKQVDTRPDIAPGSVEKGLHHLEFLHDAFAMPEAKRKKGKLIAALASAGNMSKYSARHYLDNTPDRVMGWLSKNDAEQAAAVVNEVVGCELVVARPGTPVEYI